MRSTPSSRGESYGNLPSGGAGRSAKGRLIRRSISSRSRKSAISRALTTRRWVPPVSTATRALATVRACAASRSPGRITSLGLLAPLLPEPFPLRPAPDRFRYLRGSLISGMSFLLFLWLNGTGWWPERVAAANRWHHIAIDGPRCYGLRRSELDAVSRVTAPARTVAGTSQDIAGAQLLRPAAVCASLRGQPVQRQAFTHDAEPGTGCVGDAVVAGGTSHCLFLLMQHGRDNHPVQALGDFFADGQQVPAAAEHRLAPLGTPPDQPAGLSLT